MTELMVVLRVIHIGGGVFWAGAMLFVVLFLEPSVREAGPDGAKVMSGVQRRGFMNVMPVIAILTILSGLWLTWQVSAGFSRAWIMSPVGHTYLTGAVAGLAAAVVGIGMLRPRILRAGAIARTLVNLDEPQRETAREEIVALRTGARRAGRWVAGLLLVAVVTMAVARYVPAL